MPAVHPSVVCIVVAAGSGTRLGAARPKAFVDVAGVPMLARALRGLQRASHPMRVVVVAPAALVAEARGILDAELGTGHAVVAGGATRQESVLAGLTEARDAPIVLVHDAARCLVPASLIDRVVDAVLAGADGAVPALPVVDTIRTVPAADDAALGAVVDRTSLRAMQTPQGFRGDVLRAAYAHADSDMTDDAALVQAVGREVVAVAGDERAFKITTEWDLRRAAQLAGDEPVRVGIGTDVHAFADRVDRDLRLAGLEWPGFAPLEGHSDGDAVCHAIVDALLGAAGLGDIGGMAGVDDPRFAGAHGDVFVREAVRRLHAAGWVPSNVAVQVQAARPKIGSRRREAEAQLSRLVGAPVSLSGTTTDGLGFVGEGSGVQVFATALIRRA